MVQSNLGTVLGTLLLTGMGTGGLAVLDPGLISTVAGSGAWIFRGDGIAATSAQIFLPMGVVVDAKGNLFISDASNNRIRRVDAVTGLISTVAGNGIPGFGGDNILALLTSVNQPSGITLDGAGNLYFCDTGNDSVRRVDAVTGIITTVAGTSGVLGFSGDGFPARLAKLALPEGLTFDSAGNLYIADTGNNVVRRVDASTGLIHTIAGTGVAGYNGDAQLARAAQLNSPWSVTVGADGRIIISDLANARVRQIDTTGVITTIAGTGAKGYSGDGGKAAAAQLNAPAAAVFDPGGNLYIADSGNNRVRRVSQASLYISTIAGTGDEQFSGDGGSADAASMYGPYALYMDFGGNLFVADMFHNRVRENQRKHSCVEVRSYPRKQGFSPGAYYAGERRQCQPDAGNSGAEQRGVGPRNHKLRKRAGHQHGRDVHSGRGICSDCGGQAREWFRDGAFGCFECPEHGDGKRHGVVGGADDDGAGFEHEPEPGRSAGNLYGYRDER